MERARDLQQKYSVGREPRSFYEKVLEFQRDLATATTFSLRPGIPLREQFDLEFVVGKFPGILAIAAEHGPESMRRETRVIEQAGPAKWRKILEAGLGLGDPQATALDTFLARACLQPIAENLQSQIPADPHYTKPICPACNGLSQLAILRPEGEGASRWLQCSFCLREWLYRRIICPFCGEEDKEKLPRYQSEEYPHVSVDACETCKRYLKAVNMTLDGRAIPLIDEAALPVLDVWATEHGYNKAVPNMIGF